MIGLLFEHSHTIFRTVKVLVNKNKNTKCSFFLWILEKGLLNFEQTAYLQIRVELLTWSPKWKTREAAFHFGEQKRDSGKPASDKYILIFKY